MLARIWPFGIRVWFVILSPLLHPLQSLGPSHVMEPPPRASSTYPPSVLLKQYDVGDDTSRRAPDDHRTPEAGQPRVSSALLLPVLPVITGLEVSSSQTDIQPYMPPLVSTAPISAATYKPTLAVQLTTLATSQTPVVEPTLNVSATTCRDIP